MSAWPSTLPAPNLPNYQGEPAKSFQATAMQAGNTRYRATSSAVREKLDLTFRFTAAQMAIFRTWWNEEIHQGADWFDMSLELGAGAAIYTVHATDAYKYRALSGLNWEVAFQVEVRP